MIEKHVFISDLQIPDYNAQALKIVKKFLKDFKPDILHIMGDFLNFTEVSRFDIDPYYHVGIEEEVEIGRAVLRELVEIVRSGNRKAKIIWYEGNHENRLIKYLSRNAQSLAELKDDAKEHIISIPYLFNLKNLGVQWLSGYHEHFEHGILIEHGDIVRIKAGYTAQAMIDRRGNSGISSHTHRLALITRTQLGKTKWWIETGCLCNLQPTPAWTKSPDWALGFCVGIYKDREFYPTLMPIINGKCSFGEKIYDRNKT